MSSLSSPEQKLYRKEVHYELDKQQMNLKGQSPRSAAVAPASIGKCTPNSTPTCWKSQLNSTSLWKLYSLSNLWRMLSQQFNSALLCSRRRSKSSNIENVPSTVHLHLPPQKHVPTILPSVWLRVNLDGLSSVIDEGPLALWALSASHTCQ